MDSSINTLVDSKISAIDIADNDLLKRIKTLQSSILEDILKLTEKFATTNGKINKEDPANKKLLRLLNKNLVQILNKSTFKSSLSPYLKVFDDVERISKLIIEKENGLDLKDYKLSNEKKLAIDDIAANLLNTDALNAGMVQPIKKILYRHVTTGINYTEARKELIQFINNDPDKLGFIESRVAFLVRESLSRFDGMINQKVAVDFGLDAFSIVGSLIRTSAQSCIQMITESGPFEGMAVNNKYALSDLPKIIQILSNYKGFVKGTNPNNYFINRNHYGCRHVFIPTRFLKRDKELLEKKNGPDLTQLLNPNSTIPEDVPFNGKIAFGFEKRFDDHINEENVPGIIKNVVNSLPKPNEMKSKGRRKGSYYAPQYKTMISRVEHGIDTFYHEYGHHVDMGTGNTFRSQNPELRLAINEDIKNLNATLGTKIYPTFVDIVKGKEEFRGLSDTVDAVSKGYFRETYKMAGHGKKYYRTKDNDLFEIYANAFQMVASNNKEVLSTFENYFPNIKSFITKDLQNILK